jgi:uncharacterized membrane protein YtjA (UPF0391 family)
LSGPIGRGTRGFCSGGTRKFRRFSSRNVRFHDGLFLQRRRFARRVNETAESKDLDMLGWVVTFLIIALIAGILGFGGIAGASIEIAKIIFFIAIVLFLVSAVVGVARGRTRV